MDEDCEEFNVNRYFCDDCNSEECHDHQPQRVFDEVQERMKAWYEFNDLTILTLEQVEENFSEVKPLLHYLDNIAQKTGGECECLASKTGDLIDLKNEVEEYIMASI